MRIPRSERSVAWVLVVGALDLGLEQFMVIPVLPAVQQTYSASLTSATWLVTGFLLAAVTAAPIVGRLGDMYGKRRLLLVSVGAFAVGSLVCALAESMAALIAGRVVQGMGAALGPLAIGLARDRVSPERAPVLIGLLVAAAGIGGAIGLLLGGVLVETFSVDAVFWFMFAFAVGVFLAVLVLVPETPVRESVRPDWAGGLLLAAALGTGLLAISQGNAWGWGSARFVILMVVTAVVLPAFVAVERRVSAPLVDMRLMARRPAWSANVAAFAMGFALFIAGVMITQIASLPAESGYGFGLTFAEIGLVLLPGALALIAGAWVSGSLVRRIGARALVRAGALAAALGYAWLALDHGSVGSVVAANVPLGFGIGLAFAAITNLMAHAVSELRTAVFVATTLVCRAAGAALGAQVAAAIVIGAGIVEPGFPADSGFTGAFVLGLAAALVALGAAAAIPSRVADPFLGSAPRSGTVAGS
jgi:MFS family permease